MAAPSWWPTLTVEFQWGYGVADSWSDTFTDESDRVRSISIRSGRDDELQATQASTATIVLDNRDGALDPSVNTDVRPNVRVKVYADVASATGWFAATYGLFAGFIDSVTPTWESSWGETITIECVDPLALLALYPYSAVHAAEDSDTRFATIAAAIDPSYISSSYTTPIVTSSGSPQALPAKTYTRAALLDVLNEIALAEDGVVLVQAVGSTGPKLVFVTRYARGLYFSDLITLTDAPSTAWMAEYESVDVDFSTQYVYNDVTVTDDAAHDWTFVNSSSVAKYGNRKFDLTIPVDDTDEVIRRAEWVASMYGDPRLRVKRVTLRPAPLASGGMGPWHAALFSAVWGGVTVEGDRPAGAFSQKCFVEGYTHDIDASGEWVVSVATSPVWVSPARYSTGTDLYDVSRFG